MGWASFTVSPVTKGDGNRSDTREGWRIFLQKLVRFGLGIALGLALSGPAGAYVQEDVGAKNIPSLEYQQADVREALEALFKDVGISFSIAPEVQGTVTVSLHNVTFSSALQNILRQVDATYRIQAGVYEIIRREESGGPSNEGPVSPIKPGEVVRRIRVMSADPELIALLLGAKQGTQTWNLSPEISSLKKAGSGMGNGSMGGGTSSGGMGSGSMGGLGGGSMGGLGGGSFGGTGSSGGSGRG